jgi:hypothetical protein
MAKKNTTTCCADGCSDGWKISVSAAAIGSHRTITTTFQPANMARS